MIEFFSDRAEECQVVGKPNETIVFKRVSKGNSKQYQNNYFGILLQDNTVITNGDQIIRPDGSNYFVVARRDGAYSLIGQCYKINASVSIGQITGNQNTKYTYTETHSNIIAIQKEISGAMKLYDSGLLDKTVKTFVIPIIDIELNNRLIVDGLNYQIDSIDKTTYENLLYIQVSNDKRVTK